MMLDNYKHTKQFLEGAALVAFAFAWVWGLDALGAKGTIKELALYLPGAIVFVWYGAARLRRLRKSN